MNCSENRARLWSSVHRLRPILMLSG
jgi:hypothetical protein